MIYKCKGCGGNVVYNPEKQVMMCPQCDSEESHEEYKSENLSQCVNCGAPLELKTEEIASKCTHCASYMILEERVSGELKPHLILPFKIGKNHAKDFLKKEFGSRIFAPDTFLDDLQLETIEGSYIPFFLYDYHADYFYSGEGTKIKTWRSGDKEHTETSFYRVERDMIIDFEKVPVDASIALDDKIMDLMEPYDYKMLEDFQSKYLSGFYGEMYGETVDELKPRAYQKVEKDSRDLMKDTLNGYVTLQAYHDNLALDLKKAEYALLPVWVYVFSYKGKKYEYYINGQTGKVIGIVPISPIKVMGYTSTVLASCIAIASMIYKILEVVL